MDDWVISIPAAASVLMKAGSSWGHLVSRVSAPDCAVRILAVSERNETPHRLQEDPKHFLSHADVHGTGYWYRCEPAVAVHAYLLGRQQQKLTLEGFRQLVPAARSPGAGWYIAITFTPDPPLLAPERRLPSFSAWHVSGQGVYPMSCDLELQDQSMGYLEPHWPLSELRNRRVLVVGLGSIGGAAAMALGGYGVGAVDLVDPDRLLAHNVARHVCSGRWVGKHKVNAMASDLQDAWPETAVRPYVLDAVVRADLLRLLIREADIVLSAVDGVEQRRVISYLCKRERTSSVFGAVLVDGRYGEILRLRRYREVGCLECQRRALAQSGRIDLEPTIDRGYGEGTRHNPMTAIGADLHIVGALAAKAVVATILSDVGHTDQLLADDNTVISLRPEAGWAPPFDAMRALVTSSYPSARPFADCRTCNS